MSRFLVRVVKEHVHTIEVEAEDRYKAGDVAIAKVKTGDVSPEKIEIDADVMRQMDGPWVTGFHDGAVDPDDYMHDGGERSLLVFQRSYGNAFSADEVKLLRARAEKIIGYKVQEHWNGEGTNQLSIRMMVDFKKLTPEQVKELLAPMEA